jgi:hypothetical protein
LFFGVILIADRPVSSDLESTLAQAFMQSPQPVQSSLFVPTIFIVRTTSPRYVFKRVRFYKKGMFGVNLPKEICEEKFVVTINVENVDSLLICH